METSLTWRAHWILALNTIAVTVCFAGWMLNGVLVTFLAGNQVFNWGSVEIGWLMGIPVLTGSLFRLPVGLLTQKFGGRGVFTVLITLSAIPMYLLSQVTGFTGFALCSFGFGLTGASFVACGGYTLLWYPRNWQGKALGILGAGAAGAAITTLLVPYLLGYLTRNGENIEGWRTLPVIYASILVIVGMVYFLITKNKKPDRNLLTMQQMLRPLKYVRVWRFGLYNFLVFGGFVSFSQWLIPYFTNVYYLPLMTAGFLASLFILPAGLISAYGGWLPDKFGGRTIMYWILGSSFIVCFFLVVPRMEILSHGQGIYARNDGKVTEITDDFIQAGAERYLLTKKSGKFSNSEDETLILPSKDVWQEPVVKVGDDIKSRQLIGKGYTKIFFQANIWVFVILIFFTGIIWGTGNAAVFRLIPVYFPSEVDVVGNIVGIIGGLGGFVCPVIFGYLLDGTGLWTSCWMLMFALSAICLVWIYKTVQYRI